MPLAFLVKPEGPGLSGITTLTASNPPPGKREDLCREWESRKRKRPGKRGKRDSLTRPTANRPISQHLEIITTLVMPQAWFGRASPRPPFFSMTNRLSTIYNIWPPANGDLAGQSCRDSRRPECQWDARNSGSDIPLCSCSRTSEPRLSARRCARLADSSAPTRLPLRICPRRRSFLRVADYAAN